MGNETDEQFLSGETEEEEKERRVDEAQDDSNDGYPLNLPHLKHNAHTFLNNILVTKDTTKVGNVTDEELGMPMHPVRAFKECALIAEFICENDWFKDYFNSEAENILATSLSRHGFLPKLAVIQKRVIEDETKPRKENKGWFTKKEKPEETAL